MGYFNERTLLDNFNLIITVKPNVLKEQTTIKGPNLYPYPQFRSPNFVFLSIWQGKFPDHFDILHWKSMITLTWYFTVKSNVLNEQTTIKGPNLYPYPQFRSPNFVFLSIWQGKFPDHFDILHWKSMIFTGYMLSVVIYKFSKLVSRCQ